MTSMSSTLEVGILHDNKQIPEGESSYSTEERESIFLRLKRLHGAAAIFMSIQVVAYIAADADATCRPTVGFPSECDGPICTPDIKILGTHNPIWLIILFVALAAFDHICVYALARQNPTLCQFWLFDVRANPLRWAEYSLSASVMTVAIAILCGIHDVHTWFCIFFSSATGLSLGFVIEMLPDDSPTCQTRSNADRSSSSSSTPGPTFSTLRKVLFCISSVAIFSPWMIMLCYFFKATQSGDVPDFVYAAFLGTLVLFLTFGLNSYCCHIGKYYDFHKAEMIYVILSFTAKTFLAADVFGGLSASGDDE